MRPVLKQASAAALAIAILAPSQLFAGEAQTLPKSFSDKSTRKVDMPAGGPLWIDNANGSIVVTGGGREVVIETTRVLRAADDATLELLKKQAGVVVEAKGDSRIVKSKGLISNPRALARIDFVVKVPPAIALNILSGVAERVRVQGLSGKLYVRNWRGNVEIFDAGGNVQVDTVNTNILASYSEHPSSKSQFSSVNGNIDIRVPRTAKFEWYAETMKGDILAGFRVTGRAANTPGQKTFRSSVNGGGGTGAVRSTSITGNVRLLPLDNVNALAASVLPQAPSEPAASGVVVEKDDVGRMYRDVVSTVLVQPPSARSFKVRKGRVAGNYEFGAALGENLFVGQIEGYARIVSQGGEVVLGRVSGDCKVTSQGGPINLGDIGGSLDARTVAGNVSVGKAIKGGRISTGGGSVDVRYSGGPLTVESRGGDVWVAGSSGRVSAQTRSGDIRVKLDEKGVAHASELRTLRGNATLEIPKGARVNIDATITTTVAAAHRFESDFPGLTVVRERVGDRMNIRATGKVNGGGPQLTIVANGGSIALRRAPEPPFISQAR